MTATVLFLPGGGIPAGRRVTEDGGDGGAWLGCVLRGVGVGGYTISRDKRGFSLVHCWVSGAALVVPVGPSCRLAAGCGWLCVGLCCVRTV